VSRRSNQLSGSAGSPNFRKIANARIETVQ